MSLSDHSALPPTREEILEGRLAGLQEAVRGYLMGHRLDENNRFRDPAKELLYVALRRSLVDVNVPDGQDQSD